MIKKNTILNLAGEREKKENLLLIKTRQNDKARANLAIAILEDESIKRQSEINSQVYLSQVEEEKNHISEWAYYALFFIMGVLFTLAVDGFVWMIPVLKG